MKVIRTTCWKCFGSGYINETKSRYSIMGKGQFFWYLEPHRKTCLECNGKGYVEKFDESN